MTIRINSASHQLAIPCKTNSIRINQDLNLLNRISQQRPQWYVSSKQIASEQRVAFEVVLTLSIC